MPPRSHDHLLVGARSVARAAALLVALIGACTLALRVADIDALARVMPGVPRMMPNTALAFTLFGAALFVHAGPARRRPVDGFARAAGVAGTLLAGAVALEWITGADFGLDQLLFAAGGHDAHPGRMCLTVTLALVALGAALELDRRRRIDGRVVNVIALAPLALGLLAAAGYASGVSGFTGLDGALRISPTAAIALVAAGLSLLLARPQRGSIRLLVSDGPGGLIARRLLPVAVALPLGLDGVRLEIARHAVVDHTVGDWLFAFGLMVALTAIVILLARRLEAAAAVRRAVEGRLRASEAQARSVTDTAYDAIVSAGADGAITLFNPAAERLFGWTAAEVLGRPVALLMPERYREGHRAGMARVGAGAPLAHGGIPLELHGLTKDGREFDLEVSLADVGDGPDRGVTAIMRDISARKVAEQAQRDEHARIARVVAAQTAIADGGGDLVATLELVAAEAQEIIGADGAVVELPDGDDMVYRAAVGAGASHLGMRVPIAGSLAGAVLASGESASCADAETDPRVDREACRRAGVRSMICVPLRHRAGTVGVLKVSSSVPAAFAERDVRTLELLAGLAAATVHRAQVERRLAAQHAAGVALAGARSLESGLEGALRGIGEQLGWGLGAVWLIDHRDGALTCAQTWHDAGVPAAPYLALCAEAEAAGSGTFLDTVRRSGARAWIEHPEVAPDRSPDPPRLRAAAASGLRTLIAVPIVSRGETLGVVELGAADAHTHDAATLDLLADVGTNMGQFVQRRRAEDRMAAQAANLAAVAELSHLLGQAQNAAQTRPTLVTAIRALARVDSVLLLEREVDDRLVVTAEAGGLIEVGLSLDLARDEAVAIDVLRTGRGRFVADYEAIEGHPHERVTAAGLRSAYYEPVVRDGAVAGVLIVASRTPLAKDHGGLDALMRLLAGEAGTALALSDLVATLDARARTDQLTGVANRRTWDDELPREIARARRTGEPLSLAILDLDRFKAYNDTHGHPAGDRLLRGVAASWAERLRATDVLARYGGEEFAVLLPSCDGDAAQRVAEALRAGVPDEETCSIGVVTWDGSESPDELVARADAALYRAKRDGRDRVVAA